MGDRVLLTGISGFIAKHVAAALLQAGYDVVGTLRSMEKEEAIRSALRGAGGAASCLTFVEADLTRDEGWTEAAQGCRFVIHTASPFPQRRTSDKQALVPAAVGGTRRVLKAAKGAGVERIVITSSTAAMTYGHESSRTVFGEADWSDVASPAIMDYAVSKTKAEQAAWEEAAQWGDAGPSLVCLNPSFVLGPLLDGRAGTSVGLLARMMSGRMPVVPNYALNIVDVRDVASAHVAALQSAAAPGRRLVLCAGAKSLKEMGATLTRYDPDLAGKVPRYVLPDSLVWLAGLFSSDARMAAADLGKRKQLLTDPAVEILGLTFRSPDHTIAATAESLRRFGLVE